MPHGSLVNQNIKFTGSTGDHQAMNTCHISAHGASGESGESGTMECFHSDSVPTPHVDWTDGDSGETASSPVMSVLAHVCATICGSMHGTADAVSGSGDHGSVSTMEDPSSTKGHYMSLLNIFTHKPACAPEDDHKDLQLSLGAVGDFGIEDDDVAKSDNLTALPSSSHWAPSSSGEWKVLVPAVTSLLSTSIETATLGSTPFSGHLLDFVKLLVVLKGINEYEQISDERPVHLEIGVSKDDSEHGLIDAVFVVLKDISPEDAEIEPPTSGGAPPPAPSGKFSKAVAFISKKISISELIRCNSSPNPLDRVYVGTPHVACTPSLE
jgi:hypothetical protein